MVDLSAVKTPWSTVGYLTYKRTYARRLDPSNTSSPTEDWAQTVDRVVKAADTQLHVGFTPEEEDRLRYYMLSLKGTVAGRFLWQMGTETVNKLGLPSLQNCAGCVVDEPVRPFTWTFDKLMLGCGVGFNIQREYVYKLPKVREGFVVPNRHDAPDADFIVPDSRQGWVALLDRTLRSAFYNEDGGSGFSYSTILVRGKGAPIKGFGGTASGPEELCWGIGQISKVLESRRGSQLRPIDCLDIMNIIGAVVVSGNVRRSAQIAIGDCDDLQYLQAKNWASGTVPNWRANSNNSVVCNDIRNLPIEFWDTYKGGSEPYGIINLKLSRSCGRLGDMQYKDKGVVVYNPCAEQSLHNYETCCLAEVFLPNIASQEELFDVSSLLYRINKHSLALPDTTSKETQQVVNKNMRMGIGMTGILQATEEQISWLAKTYEQLRALDVNYSEANGFPVSIKLATCKPSGTLSLLPGVTPGIHPGYARHMIRRIRVSSDSPLVGVCKEHGYDVEFVRRFDGSDDHSTVVVSFPFSYPEGTKLAKDTTALDQLEFIKKIQTEWSDNSVSCTVYYRPEELDDIKNYLDRNWNKSFKTLSFLLHSEHGFDQAPFEEIEESVFNDMVARTRLITHIDEAEFDSGDECASGVCPVR